MDADHRARLQQLLDRQDITDCLTRFSRGMDRFDRDLFLSAFHPDAVIAAGEFVDGPPELYDWAHAMHEQGQIATQHNLISNACDIDGDTAHSENVLPVRGPQPRRIQLDRRRPLFRLARTPRGQWRIALRTNAIEWSGMVPTMSIPFADIADINVNGVPARNRTDPSYQRPLFNCRKRHNPLTTPSA
jgi:SnoaL-like domain